MKEIILKALRGQLDNLPHGKNIFILKGIPLEFVGEEDNLMSAINDPLNYFIELSKGGRKFLSHEEFLLLNAFILAQYNSVYVLKNNLFMEQFPIENKFGNATKKFLLEHFTEPENDNPQGQKLSAGDEKLADIFVGLKEFKNSLIGVYNDESVLNMNKVTVLNLFDPADGEIAEVDSTDFTDLKSESDYVEFLRQIISAMPEKIFVRTQNYTGDREKLESHLKILAAQIKIFRVRSEEILPAFKSRIEFAKILKRHWGLQQLKISYKRF